MKEVVTQIPDTYFSISSTTRAPREGEVDGVNYHFISKEEFEQDIDAGFFLEWAKVHDHYYGTSLKPILKELHELKQLVRQQGLAQKEVISAEECAELLGVSVSYVYRLTSEKRLPHYKPQGKKIYFKRAELLDWLLSHRISPDAELTEHVTKRVRQASHGRL